MTPEQCGNATMVIPNQAVISMEDLAVSSLSASSEQACAATERSSDHLEVEPKPFAQQTVSLTAVS
jgi:hypothetical protein